MLIQMQLSFFFYVLNLHEQTSKSLCQMKKIIFLITLLTLFSVNTYSQTNNTKEPINKKVQKHNDIQCQLSVEDILRQQPFDIDDPKSEFANRILTKLITEITQVYSKVDNLPNKEINSHIKNIDDLVKEGLELGIDLKLLKADLNFVESLN